MSGRIVAIEGLWNISKSSLCNTLVNDIYDAKLINEPDHKIGKSMVHDIQLWYFEAWNRKMRLARKLASQHPFVFMERSFFSTRAFVKALGRSMSPQMQSHISQLEKNLPDLVVLLTSKHSSLGIEQEKISEYERSGVPITDTAFLQRYDSALRDSIMKSGVAWIQVSMTKSPDSLVVTLFFRTSLAF